MLTDDLIEGNTKFEINTEEYTVSNETISVTMKSSKYHSEFKGTVLKCDWFLFFLLKYKIKFFKLQSTL